MTAFAAGRVHGDNIAARSGSKTRSQKQKQEQKQKQKQQQKENPKQKAANSFGKNYQILWENVSKRVAFARRNHRI